MFFIVESVMISLRFSPPRIGLRPVCFALSLFATTAAGSAGAQTDTQALQTLMQRNNCTACHLIEKRKYGPNFKEIAARYAGDPEAVVKLAVKIKAGGSGVWGEEPMPPQAHVSDADARAIAQLVMTLKP
jgi:cytochrome c